MSNNCAKMSHIFLPGPFNQIVLMRSKYAFLERSESHATPIDINILSATCLSIFPHSFSIDSFGAATRNRNAMMTRRTNRRKWKARRATDTDRGRTST